jgi:dinuclear metal center YbgI/SA1388 family protein
MTATVGQAVAALSAAYPPELAEPWDTGIGLTCGDPAAPLRTVLLAVDVDSAVVAEAERVGAELLVTHHPLLFRAVQSVAADTAKGALIHRLLRSGIAHFAAHTNADKAVDGVNDALAAVLGLIDIRPLVPDPAGPVGSDQPGRTGIGRVGTLAQPLPLAAFAARVAQLLPATVGGVRAAGDPARIISVVAVCGGAGDSEMDAAAAAGADAYLTSDLRHHVVAEFVAGAGAPAVVEVAHWAGEWPWLHRAAAVLDGAAAAGVLTGSVTTTVSGVRTDPWTIAVGSARDGGPLPDPVAPTTDPHRQQDPHHHDTDRKA